VNGPPERRGFRILTRLGVRPPAGQVVRAALDEAIAAAEARSAGSVAVLDAGCGRASALRPYRDRIARFIGADIHAPALGSLPYLDDFATVDLCAAGEAFAPGSFDVILSSFTVEHFAAPESAFRNFRAWLRPGGVLVISTVNRRHPFVWAYLAIPDWLRARLQRLVKATAADAHPIVGVCNDPAALRVALRDAGFGDVQLITVGHLARAWGRRWPSFLLGALGDLAAQPVASRRSTIVISAVTAHR
jgi:SAM-dependent methyltransferase